MLDYATIKKLAHSKAFKRSILRWRDIMHHFIPEDHHRDKVTTHIGDVVTALAKAMRNFMAIELIKNWVAVVRTQTKQKFMPRQQPKPHYDLASTRITRRKNARAGWQGRARDATNDIRSATPRRPQHPSKPTLAPARPGWSEG
jgi:hypothetical protein